MKMVREKSVEDQSDEELREGALDRIQEIQRRDDYASQADSRALDAASLLEAARVTLEFQAKALEGLGDAVPVWVVLSVRSMVGDLATMRDAARRAALPRREEG